MEQCRKKRNSSVLIVLGIVCLLLFPVSGDLWAEEEAPPTIEELTGGKLKVGDLVTSENVELVKDYLTVGVYELVKQGLVLELGKNYAPWEIVPKFFRDATERIHKEYEPVVDEDILLYTKEGKPWPGGMAYLKPQNVFEVMANAKYCAFATDDSRTIGAEQIFINRHGKQYKSARIQVQMVFTNCRLSIPPLGAIPGLENEFKREMPVFMYPLELKGLGQLNIRHWDDHKNPDKGFAYIPAFKRVIRISATTWQDNMGGSDFTWGDAQGIREPFSYWDFKLIEKKNILAQTPHGEVPDINPNGSVDLKRPFDQGKRFLRDKWVVIPHHIVEATPRIKHIYGKKILYVSTPEYWHIWSAIKMTDGYDRQMKLWKAMIPAMHTVYREGKPSVQEEAFSAEASTSMYDIQAGHTTHFTGAHRVAVGLAPSMFTLKTLIAKGR